MKKVLYLLVTLLLVTTLTSCKKEVEYHYAGVYVNIMGLEKFSMEDSNLKFYYNFDKKTVMDYNKVTSYRLETAAYSSDIDLEGKKEITLSAVYNLTDMNNKVSVIYVYPIIYKDKKYEILDSEKKEMRLIKGDTVTLTTQKKYVYQDDKYMFQTVIKIFKKEV